jgi:hypothetical protein
MLASSNGKSSIVVSNNEIAIINEAHTISEVVSKNGKQVVLVRLAAYIERTTGLYFLISENTTPKEVWGVCAEYCVTNYGRISHEEINNAFLDYASENAGKTDLVGAKFTVTTFIAIMKPYIVKRDRVAAAITEVARVKEAVLTSEEEKEKAAAAFFEMEFEKTAKDIGVGKIKKYNELGYFVCMRFIDYGFCGNATDEKSKILWAKSKELAENEIKAAVISGNASNEWELKELKEAAIGDNPETFTAIRTKIFARLKVWYYAGGADFLGISTI